MKGEGKGKVGCQRNGVAAYIKLRFSLDGQL